MATTPLTLHQTSQRSHGRALFIITVFSLPLLLILLGTGDPVDMMELFNLVPVREAFRDHHWLMPTLNDIPRLEKPPLPVWIPAALASVLHSDNLWILRLPSALMALLTAWCTYGIGCTLSRDRKLGLTAALMLSATVVFNRHARLVSYDIFATAFATGTLFFLLRVVEQKKARWGYAVLAGVGAGLSILSKGPVPLATLLIPFLLWLIIFRARIGESAKWSALAGYFGLAMVVALAVFLPWLIVIGETIPQAWPTWKGELLQFITGKLHGEIDQSDLHASPFYYLQIFIWMAPFIPLFVGGLVLPFLPAQSDPLPTAQEARGRWLFWLVLLLGLLILTIPSEKKPRYALQLFPFAALLCAATWQEFTRLRADLKLNPAAVVLLVTQTLIFLGGGVGLLIALAGAFFPIPYLHERIGTLDLRFGEITLILCLLAALALLFCPLVLWLHLSRRHFSNALPWLLNCAFLLCFSWLIFYRSIFSTHHNPHRLESETLLERTGGQPIYTVDSFPPWLPTLYFANELLPPVPVAELPALLGSTTKPIYLLAGAKKGYPEKLGALAVQAHRHLTPDYSFNDDHNDLVLYRFDPPDAKP